MGEIVRSPAVTQGNCDRNRLRVLANRQVAKTADEFKRAVFDVELVDEQGEERARPTNARGTLREEVEKTWTQRQTPVLEVGLVLAPDLIQTLSFGSEGETRWLSHGTHLRSEPPRSGVPHFVRHRASARAGWPEAVLALCEERGRTGLEPERRDHGQWTEVMRRLAARSRANRPSCQGVR